MTLQAIDSTEPIRIENVVVHLFSDPGTGKSTLGNMAEQAVVFDFDQAVHRSLGRQRVLRPGSWGDMEEALGHEWVNGASTLVIDTVGRALELMSDDIIRGDGKLGSTITGLNQRGFGVLKARFQTFFRAVRRLHKDVVLISHAKLDKDKEGNKTAYPDIIGGSAGEVFKVSDAIGYYEMRGGRRVLDFNITDTHIGKNPAGWRAMDVPNQATAPRWLSEHVLNPLRDHLNTLSEEQTAVLSAVADWQAAIEEAEATPEALSALIPKVTGEKRPAVCAQAKTLLWRRATKALGFTFDEGSRLFVKPAPKEEDAPQESAQAEKHSRRKTA